MTLRFAVFFALVALVVAACSSSSSSSGSDPCVDAKAVSDSCAGKGSGDSGVTITTTWDVGRCQQAGDQGKKIAQCVLDHKTNCDCLVTCAIAATCS